MFSMKLAKNIYDVQKRFTHIVNYLMTLHKIFYKKEVNLKILKNLNRNWQPNMTAISKSRYLITMNKATLFDKLKKNELELGRLREEEAIEQKHSIALKISSKNAPKKHDSDAYSYA